ncbi:uncharacterized protein [Elaeis guineensis]|uniref:Pentatricopeptide repeat-containing protein At5g16640, mitochondrial n=1 Tax=Elaeis guineensis var. tenera TaxID=51953 RepID=A0A6I9QBX5_ELAGV|nr:pentatricopeptide repeat-containing protein At5g16640, mitochondrial [Elaeis guineensis]XP_010906517.1 pentatricopeptide repeat-containing protein At5g16640, mitochondrial [Elaeis guineensis]XP_010906518.1 pentatricopeptide repeat-containing protein At5g16640, mitochondrial [Elaeis guineensis]XP_010906519.1 pentatricopeptide repeat-containing protein At5g16640, mitochondrial [Elaeis guineensis]XP_010906520.1 pentatricopeptide repeat-containing protein At5g16640, mitochondrial [Elaeis guineen
MPWHWAPLSPRSITHKTLAFSIDSGRRISSSSCLYRGLMVWHAAGWRQRETSASRNDLIIKFSEVVKHFSEKDPSSSSSSSVPEVGARPRWPHPFDYNSLMKAFSHAGEVEEVLRLFREIKEDFHCHPDVVCYTTVVDSLVTANRPEEALAVFEEMVSSGVIPDTAAYTVLVKLYSCYLKRFDSAYEVIRWMVKCGCVPDVITYSTLIAGLCWADRVEEALGVLDQMLEEECRPNVHTYTPIVQAYCSRGRIEEARRLVDAMDAIGFPPNTVTYNVLIQALCKIRAFDDVEKLLEHSDAKGWKPDVVTYSIYMDGLCESGRADKAWEQLQVMLGNGLRPNAVTVNILLDCLCRGSKASEAKCLLERSAELVWDADVVNYNTVMSRLRDAGKWLAVLKLFADMTKKGIATNSRTFSIVIHSLCKAGKLDCAKCIFNSRGFVANIVTYTTLIHYFYVGGKVDEARALFYDMVEENVVPNQITYSVMIKCLCRERKFLEAIGCFYRSLEDGFSPNLFACLTYWLVRGKRLMEILSLLQWILKQGYIIDFCVVRGLINAFCREGCCQSQEIYILCHVLDKILGTR